VRVWRVRAQRGECWEECAGALGSLGSRREGRTNPTSETNFKPRVKPVVGHRELLWLWCVCGRRACKQRLCGEGGKVWGSHVQCVCVEVCVWCGVTCPCVGASVWGVQRVPRCVVRNPACACSSKRLLPLLPSFCRPFVLRFDHGVRACSVCACACCRYINQVCGQAGRKRYGTVCSRVLRRAGNHPMPSVCVRVVCKRRVRA